MRPSFTLSALGLSAMLVATTAIALVDHAQTHATFVNDMSTYVQDQDTDGAQARAQSHGDYLQGYADGAANAATANPQGFAETSAMDLSNDANVVGAYARDTVIDTQDGIVGQLPGIPSAPDVPSLPEMPTVEAPAVPDVSVDGEAIISDVLSRVELPALPETPEVPEAPEAPDAPGMPEMPALPSAPEAPGMPEMPALPELPALPADGVADPDLLLDVEVIPDASPVDNVDDITDQLPTPPSAPETPDVQGVAQAAHDDADDCFATNGGNAIANVYAQSGNDLSAEWNGAWNTCTGFRADPQGYITGSLPSAPEAPELPELPTL